MFEVLILTYYPDATENNAKTLTRRSKVFFIFSRK